MALFSRRESRSVPTAATWSLPQEKATARQESYLLVIAIITIVLWQVPLGQLVLYPFSLLATWFHEMGHGLTSMALGARFDELVIFPNGSGYALSSWPGEPPRLSRALTAAVGLLGPSVAGSLLIVGSRSPAATRLLLAALGLILALSTIIWVRSLAGWIVLPTFAAICVGVAIWGSRKAQRFAIELLGVQAAISLWRDLGYLFSDGGYVAGEFITSDTGAIEEALLLPYWVWGGLITATAVAIILGALRVASRR